MPNFHSTIPPVAMSLILGLAEPSDILCMILPRMADHIPVLRNLLVNLFVFTICLRGFRRWRLVRGSPVNLRRPSVPGGPSPHSMGYECCNYVRRPHLKL